MPLRAFSKLFPERFNTDGHPTGLTPSTTRLSAYNGSTIKQYGTFDTHIDWTPKGTKTTNRLHTRWFVADTPGPAILGLPTCRRLGIVELNCAVNLLQKKLTQQKTSTTECQKVQDDLEKLKPFSSREDLINAYPDRFEGIGRFPGTYHITLRKDARPVVHAPQKCPIATWPLVREKLDEWLKVLRYDHIPITIHPFPLDVHCTPARTAVEGFRDHLERLLPRSLRHCQADGLQGHHTSILRLTETSCHPGRCVTEGTRSSTPARWMPCHLRFQSSHPDRAMIRQHRT